MNMDGKYGYCDTCKGEMCRKCYRGSHYESDNEKNEYMSQYGTY